MIKDFTRTHMYKLHVLRFTHIPLSWCVRCQRFGQWLARHQREACLSPGRAVPGQIRIGRRDGNVKSIRLLAFIEGSIYSTAQVHEHSGASILLTLVAVTESSCAAVSWAFFIYKIWNFNKSKMRRGEKQEKKMFLQLIFLPSSYPSSQPLHLECTVALTLTVSLSLTSSWWSAKSLSWASRNKAWSCLRVSSSFSSVVACDYMR